MTEPGPDVVVVECSEYDNIEIDTKLWLSEGHETVFNSEIDGRDVLRANFRRGVLRLQATSYVGVIPLNERVIVRVKPRVPLSNLTRMVVETGHSLLALSAFRDYSGRGTADDWAMDIYTDALLDYVETCSARAFCERTTAAKTRATFRTDASSSAKPSDDLPPRASPTRRPTRGTPAPYGNRMARSRPDQEQPNIRVARCRRVVEPRWPCRSGQPMVDATTRTASWVHIGTGHSAVSVCGSPTGSLPLTTPCRGRTPGVDAGATVCAHGSATKNSCSVTDALSSLLRASHLLAPDDLAATAAAVARQMGVRDTVLYLADYEQATLLPLPGARVPERQELPIEGTMAGRAFRRVEIVTSTATQGTHRLWVPLLDGVERLGVAELDLPAPPSPDLKRDLQVFVTLVAELLVVSDAYSDVFSRLRRRKTLSLAAEMQWELLPPLSFGTERLVITGGLEPAYDIGGDSFDYAVNGSAADLLVIDSVGHGLPATVLACVAINAYRHARRNALDLPEIAAEINTAIAGQFAGSQFATAVLSRLDIDTGRLRWINAGHPAPLILRGSSLVRLPHCPPSRPLGLQERKPACCETRLQPGDRLLLYTDGITEARSPDGEFFGEQRLADFIAAAVAAGEPAPETVRQLMRHVLTHQADQLQDDASIVVLEWLTGDEAQLPL